MQPALRTFGELKASGYRSRSVKAEMRENLIRLLKTKEPLFPGMLGYEETVVPEITNAILSQHDMLFLGLRGQGKTRMLRMLTRFLDDWLPAVAGSEIHDDPFAPLSRFARDRVETLGDACPIEWVPRDRRYLEKLATPDVTIADLIGEIDLVKHAEGKHLSHEDVMHFGLIPRANRCIFCLNELPDLSPKIQVGLFNILEERDVQIRGFPIRLELDLCLAFSANPEDYTNRGRIVTPLKDRIGSVIQTHYPLSPEVGIAITDENAWTSRGSEAVVRVPRFLKEIVEEISALARKSPHVNQASGVSVRMSIANFENLLSNAERRAITTGQATTVARVCDLWRVIASSRGKLEWAMSDESGDDDRLVERIVSEAIKNVFDRHAEVKGFKSVTERFSQGESIEVGDDLPMDECQKQIDRIAGFRPLLDKLAQKADPQLAGTPHHAELLLACAEWALEALHAHNKLNRHRRGPHTQFGG